MNAFKSIAAVLVAISLQSCQQSETKSEARDVAKNCPVELVILGIGQDAGAPQIGNTDDPAWNDPSKQLYATSLGLLDHENGKRYLFEATPDIRAQMQVMDELLPPDGEGPYIDGIFITHAHIGHYAGLMFLGRESMGAKGVPVYVMPRMKEYLETNGPWSQLVELGNIELRPDYPDDQDIVSVGDDEAFYAPGNYAKDKPIEGFEVAQLLSDISVHARIVEHRDEFSETAAYTIKSTSKKVFFVPDIDRWNPIRKMSDSTMGRYFPNYVRDYDLMLLDATFYDDKELPGRDMSKIPHPRVTESMDLIEREDRFITENGSTDFLRPKTRFIHINHTNPLRDENSDAFKEMTDRGYKLAYRGERFCL